MSFEFNPTIWFICKLCKKSCSDTEELKTHKLENHLGDCIKIKCIIFEEKLLSYDWTPEDQNKLVENQRPNDESMKPKNCKGSSSVTVLKQNQNLRNPYISIPRVSLNATEQLISGAVSRNLPSNSVRSYGRKQTRETQQAAYSSKPATVRTEAAFAKQTRAQILAKQKHESYFTQISDDLKIEVEDDTRESDLPSLRISRSIFEACSTDANAVEAVGSSPLPSPVKQSMVQVHRSGPKVQISSILFNATIPGPSLPSKKPSSSVLPFDPARPKPVLKTYSRKPAVTPAANAVRIMGDADIFSDEVEATPKTAAPPSTAPPNKKRNRSNIVITVLSSDDEEEDKGKVNKIGKRGRIRNSRVPSPLVKNVKTAVKKRPAKSPSVVTKKRGRKPKPKPPVCWVPLSFPQWLRLLKDIRLNGRNRIQQNFQQSIFPENTILLDPDPTSADFDSKSISQENAVTCLLCSTKLVTQSELQLHADNCWFHNTVFHRYCVPCGISFENPLHLGQHRLHAHFDPIPGNDLPNIDLPVDLPLDLDRDEADLDSNASSSLSLGQWIRRLEAKKNGNLPFPKIIILLDPDPTAENYQNSHESHFNPIKCKLCETSLGSEAEVKKHVARCWTHHKNRHRFCVFCQRSWKSHWSLRVHTKLNHEEGPKFPFECHLCHTGFLNELDWKRHAMSLAKFRPIVNSKRKRKRAKTILDKTTPRETPNSNDGPASSTNTKPKNVNKRKSIKYACQLENESTESEGETWSSTRLGDWIKEQRKTDPSNIIRVQPDPTEPAHEVDAFEVSESNPVNCKLCQTAFTSEKLLRRHLLKCWLHNKRSHRYCLPCERVFGLSKNLDKHNSKMHCSTPRPTFTCRLCPSTFVDRRGVIRHEWINHGNIGEKPELLPTRVSSVKLKAIQEPRLKISLESRIQLKPFKCEFCGIGFPYNFLLQKHHECCRHRFLKCPHVDCSEKFKYKESLERHLDYAHNCSNRETAASKKFHCREPGCSTAVKFIKNLLVHIAKVHGRSRAEFACSSCPKIFMYKEHLEYHERIHRRARPFKCSVEGCERAFMSHVSLYSHLRSNHYKTLGLPEHLCPVCGKMYGLKGRLDRHILLTHNETKS